ncbi:MAG: FadR family transcriptional regulator [Chloroflexi bacterium]|nr:FadR family transcriptional regulator [Chloroflexota bacterium]
MKSIADRSTLVDDTADRLRTMIFSEQIKPGQLLPPRKELAAQFGVGIATVHEAVKSLAAVGLLESRPGKGTWVSHNALQSVIHPSMILNRFGAIDAQTIYEARLALEVSLAELAAQKATPEEIQRMFDALDAAQKVIDDDAEFVRSDWEFHMAVAKATHNVLLQAFYHLSRELLLEFIRDVIRLPQVKEEASKIHRVEAEAIARHDVEAACTAAREHMLYLKQKIFPTSDS